MAQKLEELALILDSYNSLCVHGKKDPRDQMSWLLDELADGEFAENHTFYIDGFPDFTRQHMAILVHLIKHAPNVIVSITCDRVDSQMLAFEKFAETAAMLIKEAKKNGVAVDIRRIPERDTATAEIRRVVLQGKIDTRVSRSHLRVVRSDTQHHECMVAAERILELVHNGARYRDISLVCADPSYATVLEMVLERCHIPAYFSGTDPIIGKSVIATVLAAMDTALSGFEKQDVIRYIKSPLSPLDIQLSDKVENYAALWNISGKEWLRQWKYHPAGLGAAWNDHSREELQLLESARLRAIEPLVRLNDALHSGSNIAEQVKALYAFFCEISLDKRLDLLAKEYDTNGDNRSAQILNQLWDILMRALEQLHDSLSNTVWEVDTLVRLLRLLLSQYNVGTIPTVLDSVVAGPVSALRCQQVKHLIVVGALEGCLPGYGGSSGILTDQERVMLRCMGVPLTGGSIDGLKAEFAEIYGMFCGASESVTISCPDGQPSFIYRRLQELAEEETVINQPLGSALADSVDAGAYLARFDAAEYAENLGIHAQFSQIQSSSHHTLGAVSSDNIHALYGDKLNLSASQIDKLADCRFHYFMRYGIRAKELKPATVDPAEFGTYVHAVLENTAREIVDMGGFHNVTQEQTLEIALKYSRAYTQERFEQLSGERVNYLFNRNIHELELIVQELWDELSKCDFEPIGFEVSFGNEGVIPAVDCSGTKLEAQLGGFVDRVDCWTSGDDQYFRVVDYKTGKKDFDYCDVFNGLGLQMLLYMFALEQDGSKLVGENPVPAGVQYFPARVPFVATDGQISDEEAIALRQKNWKRKGLILSDESVLNAMGAEEAAFRLPFTRRKDGTINGDIADLEQFSLLKKYVFSLLKKLVDDIASGNVAPNPYTRGGSHDACAFCPYGAVCHKTKVEGRRNYKAMTAVSFWNYVKQEVEDNV